MPESITAIPMLAFDFEAACQVLEAARIVLGGAQQRAEQRRLQPGGGISLLVASVAFQHEARRAIMPLGRDDHVRRDRSHRVGLFESGEIVAADSRRNRVDRRKLAIDLAAVSSERLADARAQPGRGPDDDALRPGAGALELRAEELIELRALIVLALLVARRSGLGGDGRCERQQQQGEPADVNTHDARRMSKAAAVPALSRK